MERMSARFLGKKIGESVKEVYGNWEKLDLVVKD